MINQIQHVDLDDLGIELVMPDFSVMPPLSWVIAGMQKTGKSTFASNWPSPLFIECEDGGTDYISGIARIKFPDLTDVTQNRVTYIFDWLKKIGRTIKNDQTHKYQTIVIDSIDFLWNKILAAYRFDGKSEFTQLKWYGSAMTKLSAILQSFFDLNVHVVLICHVDSSYDTEKSATIYNLSMSKSITGWVRAKAKVILFIQSDEVGGGVHRLVTRSSSQTPAGDRTGRFPASMPMTFAALEAAYAGQDPEPFQPNITIPTFAKTTKKK